MDPVQASLIMMVICVPLMFIVIMVLLLAVNKRSGLENMG